MTPFTRGAFVAATFLVIACQVAPENPFDPSTPPQQQARAQVSGTVLGGLDGTAPLTGAVVTLEGATSVTGSPAMTGADGTFVFADLLPGRWTLTITHPQHLRQVRDLDLVAGATDTVRVTLDPIPADDRESQGRITGRALRSGELARPENERDHSGILVEVESVGVRTVTATDGSFDLFLQPGSYNIVVSTRHYNLARRNGVVVTAGETTEVPDNPIVLDGNPGTVSGRVRLEGSAEDGQHGDVQVSLLGSETNVTTADGTFRITGVAAGTYALVAAKAGWDSVTFPGVVVEGGRDTTIPDLRLNLSRGSITGRVRLAGRSDHSGVALAITGTTHGAVSTPDGSFRIDRVPVGAWELTARRDGFTRAVVGGVQVGTDATTDAGTLQLAVLQGDFEIDDGAQWTRDRTVTLALSSENATTMRVSEDPTFTSEALGDTAFRDFDAAPTFELTDGDGPKEVFVQLGLADGTQSGVLAGNIVLDTTPPEGGEVVIDRGAAFTRDNSGHVSLALAAADATSGLASMQISNDTTFNEPWVPFSPSIVHTLGDAGTDGERTVWVRFRDAAGNETPEAAFATITLDRTAPLLGSFQITCEGRTGAAQCRSSLVSLAIEAEGASRMLLSNEAGFPGTQQEPFAAARAWLLEPGDGTRTVHLQLVDEAGNRAAPTSATTIIDGTAPGSPLVRVETGPWTRTKTLNLQLGAIGADELRIDVRDVAGERIEGEWETFATTRAFTLPDGPDGAYRIEATFRDRAGNTSTTATTTVTLDREAPTGAAVRVAGGAVSATANVSLELSAFGASRMAIALDGTLDTEDWETFSPVRNATLPTGDGTKTIVVRFRDDAGNETTSVSTQVRLDTTLPGGSVRIAGGAAWTRTAAISITLEGVDADVASMQLSEDAGFAGASWQPFVPAIDRTLSGADGPKTVYARFRDAAGNTGPAASASITLDTQAPTSPQISIAGGATLATTAVALTLGAVGASEMRIDVIDTDGSRRLGTWETYATAKSLTLPTGDGSKRVDATFRDAAGNESTTASAQVTLDTVAPTAPSLAIRGAPLVASRALVLELSATGATQMRVAPDGTLDTELWETFAPTRNATLPTGDGEKTVKAEFRDAAGNVSTSVTATVTVDTTAPTGVVAINNGASRTTTSSVTVAFSDVSTDVASVRLASADSFAGAVWQPFLPSFTWTLTGGDGNRTVYAQLRDAAGNASAVITATITLDSQGPTSPSVTITQGLYIRTAAINLTIGAVGADEMRVDVIDVDGSRATGSWESYATTKTLTLPTTQQGTKRVEITFRDLAGNTSTVASAQTTYDTAAPTGAAIAITAGDYATSSSIAVTLAATGASQMAVAADGVIDTEPWETFTGSKNLTLPGTDGAKTVAAKFRDEAGNETATVTDSVTLDTGKPDGTIAINGGAARTNQALVSLSFSGVSSDVVEMQLSNVSGFTGATWQAYTPSLAWTLTTGDGAKTVYAKFRDAAGNISNAPTSANITLDAQAPTSPTVAITQGLYVRTAAINLTIGAVGADEMRVDVIDADGSRSVGAWEAYATSKAISLPTTLQGTKRVEITFRDLAGNTSTVASAQTTYDTVAPTGAAIAITAGDYATSSAIAVTLAATGASQMAVAADGVVDTEPWETFAGSKNLTLPGTDGAKSVAAKFRDEAGNETAAVTDSVTLDTGKPDGTIAINGGAARTNQALVSLSFSGVSSDVVEMQLSNVSGFTGATWQAYTPSLAWTLTSGDGAKTVYAKFRDAAGNVSNVPTSANITLDAQGPTSPTVSITQGLYVRTAAINLTIGAVGGDEMRVDVIDADGSRSVGTWEAYATSKALSLPTTLQGTKRVEITFRDLAGNTSTVASAQTTYDTVAPTGAAIAITAGDYATSSSIAVTLAATGASQMAVAADGVIDTEPWETFAGSKNLTLPGTDGAKTVAAKFRDEAGNETATVTDSVTLDTGKPDGTIAINGGAARTNQALVSLSFSGVSTDVVEMQLSNVSGFTGATWQAYTPSLAWTLTTGDGAKTVYAKFRDAAGNVSNSATNASITLDTQGPTSPTVSITQGLYVGSAAITLTIGAVGADEMRVDVVDVDGSRTTGSWEAYATSKPVTLPTTLQGTKRVEVTFRDLAGNTSAAASAQTTYDTVAPTGPAIVITSGDYATSTSINVTLTATGAAQMVVAADGTIDTEPWETFTATKGLTLPATDGPKTVAAKFRDEARNETATVTDTVTLDTGKPDGVLAINGGAARTNQGLVSLSFTGVSTDVVEMQLSNVSAFTGATWQAYSPSLAWTLTSGDGAKTVYAKFRDGAGNVSNAATSASITLDTQGPTSPTVAFTNGAFTNTASVTLTLSAVGADELRIDVIDVDGGRTTGAWGAYATSRGITLPSTLQGTKRVEVTYRDLAGNTSSIATAQTTYDTVGPTNATVSISQGAYTRDTDIDLVLSALGASQMRIAADGVLDSEAWETYATTKSVTLPTGDGTKFVRVTFRDDALNTTSTVSASTTLDEALPSGTITLNAGDASTASTAVTATLTRDASTTNEVMVSTDPAFAGAAWQTFAGTVSVTLSSGDAEKTVYAKLRDLAGNESSVISDKIVLDTTGPTGIGVTIGTGESYTNNPTVTLTLVGGDATQMKVSNRVDFAVGSWVSFATNLSWTLDLFPVDGERDVYVKFRDALGNESTVAVATIGLDRTAPLLTTLLVNAGAQHVTSNDVTLSLAASDNYSGVDKMQFARTGSPTTLGWETYATTKNWQLLPPPPGSSTVGVNVLGWVRDAAGNVSATTTVAMVLDQTVPTITSVTTTPANLANDTRIELAINATDASPGVVSQMIMSENPTFVGAPWETFSSTRTFQLSSTNGTKRVYVRVRDAAGRESASGSATLVLDTQGPTIASAAVVSGTSTVTGTSANGPNVKLRLTVNDNLTTGTDFTYAVSTTDIDCKSGSVTYTAASGSTCTTSSCTEEIAVTLASTTSLQNVYACVRDKAGNVSQSTRASVFVDLVNPATVTGLSGTAYSREMEVTWRDSTDTGSGVAQYRVDYSPDGFVTTTSSLFTTATTLSITGLQNRVPYTVRVYAVDGAGRLSTTGNYIVLVPGLATGKGLVPMADRAPSAHTSVVAGGWLFSVYNIDDNSFEVRRCDVARVDCRSPGNWFSSTNLPPISSGYTFANSKPYAMVSAYDRIWIATSETHATLAPKVVLYSCDARTGCGSSGLWTRTDMEIDASIRRGPLELHVSPTRLVFTYLKEVAANDERLVVANCSTGSACTSAAAWTKVTVTSGTRAYSWADSEVGVASDTSRMWITYRVFSATASNNRTAIMYCDWTSNCDAAADFTAYPIDALACESDADLVRTGTRLYVSCKPTSGIYLARCDTSTGCDAAADWTTAPSTSEAFVTSTEASDQIVRVTLAAEGTRKLHAAYFSDGAASVRYASCTNPDVTDCTKGANWTRFTIDTNVALFTWPSLVVHGTVPLMTWLDQTRYLRYAGPRFMVPADAGFAGGTNSLRGLWTNVTNVDGYDLLYRDVGATEWEVSPIGDALVDRTTISVSTAVDQEIRLRTFSNGEVGDETPSATVRPFSSGGGMLPQNLRTLTCNGGTGCAMFAATSNGTKYLFAGIPSGSVQYAQFSYCDTSVNSCAQKTHWATPFQILNYAGGAIPSDISIAATDTYLYAALRTGIQEVWFTRCAFSTGCDQATDFSTPVKVLTGSQGALQVTAAAARVWVSGVELYSSDWMPKTATLANTSDPTVLANWVITRTSDDLANAGAGNTALAAFGNTVTLIKPTATGIRRGYCSAGSLCDLPSDFTWTQLWSATDFVTIASRAMIDSSGYTHFTAVTDDRLWLVSCRMSATFCSSAANWSWVPLTEWGSASGTMVDLRERNGILYVAWANFDETTVASCRRDCWQRENWNVSPVIRNLNMYESSTPQSFLGVLNDDRIFMSWATESGDGYAAMNGKSLPPLR